MILLSTFVTLLSTYRLVSGVGLHGFHFRGLEEPQTLLHNDEDRIVESWITQPLDHFNHRDNRTWQMRYYENAGYLKKNGPIFIMIGGEWAISPGFLQTGLMHGIASKHNGIMYYTEHRYYGQSRPTKDTSPESLQYLNVDQALADLAYFIETKKKEENFRDSKVIVFGGSYAGNMAAWAKLKYPHLIQGALASSAPVYAKADFYEYYEVVRDSLRRYSEQCTSDIKAAFEAVEELLATESGPEKLQTYFNNGGEKTSFVLGSDIRTQTSAALLINKEYTLHYHLKTKLVFLPPLLNFGQDHYYFSAFNLCYVPDTKSPSEIGYFMNLLSEKFAGIVQYDKVENGRTKIAASCENMTASYLGSPLQRLARFVSREGGCLQNSYRDFLKVYRNESWESRAAAGIMRQWYHQTCTEYGYYQTSSSKASIFGTLFPLTYYTDLCVDLYGDYYDNDFLETRVRRTNIMYGGVRPDLKNVIFTNGDIDPWHALSVLRDLNESSPSILIKDSSHCRDLYNDEKTDSEELINARASVRTIVSRWIANKSA